MEEFTTFETLLKPLSEELLTEAVKRYNTDYYCKSFDTRTHLLAMLYVQIHELKSLRDFEVAFNSQEFLKSMISSQRIARSTLSDANERRSPACFLWIAEQLMCLLPRKERKEVNKVIKKLDS